MNLFGAVTNGLPVNSATLEATFSLKPAGAFNPVPTAVPPTANSRRPRRLSAMALMHARSCAA